VVAAFVEKAWVCVSLPWVQSDGVEQATGELQLAPAELDTVAGELILSLPITGSFD